MGLEGSPPVKPLDRAGAWMSRGDDHKDLVLVTYDSSVDGAVDGVRGYRNAAYFTERLGLHLTGSLIRSLDRAAPPRLG